MSGKYYNPNGPRKKKKMTVGRFLKRYSFWLVAAVLFVFCVVVTVGIVKEIVGPKNPHDSQLSTEQGGIDGSNPSDGADSTLSTQAGPSQEVLDLLGKAQNLAYGYDYTAAIELLRSYEGYQTEQEIVDAIARFEEQDDKLVSQTKQQLNNVPHIFFHSLIVDADRAFDGDGEEDGYNLYMCTTAEFVSIMEQMYRNGYVLVNPHDIAYEVTDETGTHMVYGDIRLPAGKKPFLLSQDDLNYYSYMIGVGDGKNETPIFADKSGDGFAHKIVIDENGYPVCEYMDADGNIHVGDYDLVPLLEKFIQEHPDFSYKGARAMLGLTGYEGVFGYRTKPSYETAMGTAAYQKEVEQAKQVAQCLRDHGWIIASHSYGHPRYGDLTAGRVDADSTRWENTVQVIVGDTDVILYPHGSDINSWRQYTFANEKYKILYEDGYRYFFNVDSTIGWTQITDTSFRGGRVNIDGYRMWNSAEKLAVFFDVESVFDPRRPTPVPPLSGSM